MPTKAKIIAINPDGTYECELIPPTESGVVPARWESNIENLVVGDIVEIVWTRSQVWIILKVIYA